MLVKKLQWDFLSLCRAYALQKVHLSHFLPLGHQIRPGTRGCSEPGPRSEPGGAGNCEMGVSTFAWCCDSGRLAGAAVARWLMLPLSITAEGDFPLPYSPYKCPQLAPSLDMDLSSMHSVSSPTSDRGINEDTPGTGSQKLMYPDCFMVFNFCCMRSAPPNNHLLWRFIFLSPLYLTAFCVFPTLLPFPFVVPRQHGQYWLQCRGERWLVCQVLA